jgi:hypothetical protein
MTFSVAMNGSSSRILRSITCTHSEKNVARIGPKRPKRVCAKHYAENPDPLEYIHTLG